MFQIIQRTHARSDLPQVNFVGVLHRLGSTKRMFSNAKNRKIFQRLIIVADPKSGKLLRVSMWHIKALEYVNQQTADWVMGESTPKIIAAHNFRISTWGGVLTLDMLPNS